MLVNRIELIDILEAVAPGLSPREIIEQSTCFVFQNKIVQTFNDEISFHHASLLNIEGAVRAAPLLSLLKKMNEKEVEVETKKGKLIISGNKKKAGILMDKKVTLPVDKIETPQKWKKLPSSFTKAISMVKHCAGKDETKFATTCIHLHTDWIESFDNYQAARYLVKTGIKKPTLVRKDAIQHLVGLKATIFSETPRWIHFTSKDEVSTIMSIRRYEEKFPDLSPLFKARGEGIQFPKNFGSEISRASTFTKDSITDNVLKIILKDNKIKVVGKGELGWYQGSRKIRYEGKPQSFLIAPELLNELIKKMTKCELTPNTLLARLESFHYVTALGSEE
jgi:DNA polymerase III sliding clamp (beta) subunit (PCNA family)